MLDKYVDLIGLVRHANEKMKGMSPDEADIALWMEGGKKFVVNGVYGAYSSDSIVLWAHHWFPLARGKTPEELYQLRKNDPNAEWSYWPIPNDRFIETCNELLCHALSVGLPLRGGLASGSAVIDVKHSIFLGQPLIDAVLLEGAQRVIGASLCKSIADACSPEAYVFAHSAHLRDGLSTEQSDLFSGLVLDWPAHWTRTRQDDLKSLVNQFAKNSGNVDIFKNTVDLIEASAARGLRLPNLFDKLLDLPYPQFSRTGVRLGIAPQFEGSTPHPRYSVRGV